VTPPCRFARLVHDDGAGLAAKAGLRTFTLQKWRVNEGRITVTVDFSDQTMKIE
jgi:hypothetical protein